MRELMNIAFESGALPADWTAERNMASFERGALRSGFVTSVHFALPGNGWRAVRVEVDVEPLGGAALVVGDGTVSVCVDLARGVHRVMCYGMAELARAKTAIEPKTGTRRVAFEFDRGRLRALVDGREVVAADDPSPAPAAGLLDISFWDDCLIHRARVLGDDPLDAPVHVYPSRKRDDFFLEVNVDFFDDLIHAPFTPQMFDRLFAEFKSWGVKRCHWFYYGGAKHGWWRSCPMGVDRNAAKTVENCGEIFDAAVAAAHEHDVEIFGMIKPFDMGFWYSYGEGTQAAKTRGKRDRIGGPVGWIADFPAQHPDFLMSRRPDAFGPAENESFTRIDLVKDDASTAAFSVADMRLYVSDDNATYRPYQGPMEREETVEDYPVREHTASGGRLTGERRRCRVMRLKDLDLGQNYFALAVDGRARSFENTFINLVHVFGEKGEERRLTYGVKPRADRAEPNGAGVAEKEADFIRLGVEFDTFPGTPSAVFPGYDAIRAPWALDGADGFLALARGKDRSPVAALSPAFPETRTWWLEWASDCLTAGADGIELRVRNHHSPFAWAEFGFEAPVLRAFKERYGVDLAQTDDFDRAAWRRLRGEAYTAFYREARALTQSFGKPLGLHVSQTMCTEPEFGCAMDIHWDWRAWLDDGLADSVTMKEVWPRTRFAEDVLSHARPMGIPVIFCPYANNLWGSSGGERVVADRIRLAREGGYDGFQYYECASVMRARPDGALVMRQPALRDVFRRNFGA